jgi:ABC-type lipoprotein release transport system permease subunit
MRAPTLILRLAVRNLFRHTRRTVLTATVIVAGVGLLVLGEAVVAGSEDNIVVSAIDALVGHVQARPAGYPTQPMQHPVDKLLTIDAQTTAWLDQHTVAWTGRQLFTPTLVFGAEGLRVRAFGYDPVRDAQVFPRDLWKVRGRQPDPAKDEILVSRGVAQLLDIQPGDRLVLQTRTHLGAMNALEVQVAGIVATTQTVLDSMSVLVPLPLSSRLLDSAQPSHLSLRLASRDLAPAAKVELARLLGRQATVVTWQDETRELVELMGTKQGAMQLMVAILMLLAGFGIANTLLMAAYERVREVGTLRALGLTEGGVVALFVVEGALVGVMGSLVGIAWGGALSLYWQVHPMELAATEAMGANLPMSSLLYTRFDPWSLFAAAVFGVAVAMVASILPARTAARVAPADAVRAE